MPKVRDGFGLLKVSFFDDVSSPMTIPATLRYVKCNKCRKPFQLSYDRIETALQDNLFICATCKRDSDATRPKSKNTNSP
jgi:hypothetical protein